MTSSQSLRAGPGSDSADRILAAAEQLFAEHGFGAVSMNAIAEAAGVSKANVFHHFTSKKDLYMAVLRRACQDASQHLDDLGGDETPLAERLAQFAFAHLTSVFEHAQTTRLSLRELLNDDNRQGRELAEEVYGEKFARFVTILRAGQESGELRRDVDPAMVATVLLGANLFFFQARDVLRHFPDVRFGADPQRYSGMLVEILLHGIRPTPRPN